MNGLANSPLKVLFVAPGSAAKCSMVFVRRQVASLEALGVNCQIFCLRSQTNPWSLWQDLWRLRKNVSQFHPQIVHAQFGTVTAFLCTVSTRLPLVVTFRGSDLNRSANRSRLRSATGILLSQLAALMASRNVCVSQPLRQRLWWTKKRTAIIPTGVDLTLFRPRPKRDARRQLHMPLEDRVILFNAGTQPKHKRLDLAEAAAEVARPIVGDVRLLVLNGETAPEQIPFYMNAADCLLLTSNAEGSPNVVKEALACNLPVISVDIGDVSERLDGVTPSRIVSRNPQDIGAALAELLKSPQRSNGRQKVCPLSLDKTAQQMLDVYQRILL